MTEVETADAMLGAKFTCIEYDDSIYAHTVLQSDGAVGVSGIPGWWTGIWGGTASIPIIGDIVITDPANATANIVDPGNGNVVGSPIDYSTIDWPNVIIGGEGGQGGITSTPETPLAVLPITIPDIPGLDEIEIEVATETGTGSPKQKILNKFKIQNPLGGSWAPSEIPFIALPLPENPTSEKADGTALPNLPNVKEPKYDIRVFGHGIGDQGKFTTLPSATVPEIVLDNKGGIPGASLASQAVGFSVDEAPAAAVMPMAGELFYTTTGAFTGNTLTFNEEGYPNLIVGGVLSGTGITPVTVITAVTGNSSITTNINVNVASGATIGINNAIPTALGEPASFIVPATVSPLGGADLGKYGLKSDFQPFGTLPGGGGALGFAVFNTVDYTEVDETTNEPTGTTIQDAQSTSGIGATFNNLPPAVVENDTLEISEARGLAVAQAAGVTTTGKKYIPKQVSSQPSAFSTLYPNTAGKPNFTLERLRAGDSLRDLF